jgi:hypothetical protein
MAWTPKAASPAGLAFRSKLFIDDKRCPLVSVKPTAFVVRQAKVGADMKKWLLCGFAVVASTLVPVRLIAAITTTTFTGTVTLDRGVDEFGVFGTPLENLGGQNFTAVFTTDDATTNPSSVPYGSAALGYSAINFATTGALTISGVSLLFRTSDAGELSVGYDPNQNFNDIGAEALGDFTLGADTLYIDAIRDLPSFDFHGSFSYTEDSGTYAQCQYYRTCAGFLGELVVYGPDLPPQQDDLFLDVSAVTNTTVGVPTPFGGVPPTTGVAEPSTWTMLILGIGCLGGIRRTRNHRFSVS